MKAVSSVRLPVGVDAVVPWVSDLGRFREWMPIVHRVEPDPGAGDADAWNVELRAKVGPFARSKRLRMERTAADLLPGRAEFLFERRETDGAPHSAWVMHVTVSETAGGCEVAIDLEYRGSLWSAGVLDKVLAAQIEEGKKGILRVVTAPMP